MPPRISWSCCVRPRRALLLRPRPPPFPAPELLLPRTRRPGSSRPRSLQQQAPPARAFATTPRRGATAAICNPRRDDEGNEMTVEITPRASNRLREIMAKDANPNLALRITVQSGGCHGFQYLMALTTLPLLNSHSSSARSNSASPTVPSPDHNTLPLSTSGSDSSCSVEIDPEDTVFQALDGSGARVVMDAPSLELLKGSKIDYTMELIGSQFKIVDNPLATSSCGCGTSFDIKA